MNSCVYSCRQLTSQQAMAPLGPSWDGSVVAERRSVDAGEAHGRGTLGDSVFGPLGSHWTDVDKVQLLYMPRRVEGEESRGRGECHSASILIHKNQWRRVSGRGESRGGSERPYLPPFHPHTLGPPVLRLEAISATARASSTYSCPTELDSMSLRVTQILVVHTVDRSVAIAHTDNHW